MTISDLLQHRILPFENNDVKLTKLFSFFLHSAPTIDSQSAAIISAERLEHNWENYINTFNNNEYCFLSPNYSIEKYFDKFNLTPALELKRKTKAFACKRKDSNETDYTCFLRHIRNAIAHSNVYVVNAGNRKFILFEDFNKSKKQSSRILLSQTDLKRLKDEIMK